MKKLLMLFLLLGIGKFGMAQNQEVFFKIMLDGGSNGQGFSIVDAVGTAVHKSIIDTAMADPPTIKLGTITSINAQKRRAILMDTVTGNQYEIEFISKSPELMEGETVRYRTVRRKPGRTTFS